MSRAELADLFAAAYLAGLADRPLITSATLTPTTAAELHTTWARGASARPVPLDDTGRAPAVPLRAAEPAHRGSCEFPVYPCQCGARRA